MIVQESQHNSALEEFYEDDAWREAIKADHFKNLTTRLWRVVIGLVVLCGLWILGLGLAMGPDIIAIYLLFYVAAVMVCFIGAALLAIIIAMAPMKKFDYGDRIYLILPILLIALGIVGVCLLLLMTIVTIA